MAAAGEIDVFGKLVSQATNGVLAGADQIKDTTQNKMQSTINSELYAAVENVAHTVDGATQGHFAGLDGQGNLTDSGVDTSNFLSADYLDLIYAGL